MSECEEVAGTPLSEPGALLRAIMALLRQAARSPCDDEGHTKGLFTSEGRGPRASVPGARQELVFQLHLAFRGLSDRLTLSFDRRCYFHLSVVIFFSVLDSPLYVSQARM